MEALNSKNYEARASKNPSIVKVKATRNSSSRKLGRPPKNRVPLQDNSADDEESGHKQQSSDGGDDAGVIAECVSNGFKFIRCCICDATFLKIYQLRQHMQLHTQNNGTLLEGAPVYEVLNPHQRNIDPSVIRDFLIGEINQKRYSQFYVILTEAGVELHISDSETDSSDVLTSDEESDVNKGTKTKNVLIPQNTYKCELCYATFDRRHKALFHQHTTHVGECLSVECDYCGRQFVSVQLLIHHLKTRCESDEQPISCVERFRQHLLKVNLEQFEYLAQARKDLKLHRLTTADKLYSCNVCQKTFLRSEHLTRHKAVHLPDELKMECPVCFRKFNRKDNLRTHMKVHMDEAEREASNDQPAILCQYCGHCFTSKSNYVVHMRRRHTGDKPYACDVCGKGFPKSTDLNSHKITHSGERKFHCSICNKAFARSAVLSKHMRVHNGPYHCTYCDLSFVRPNELAQHLLRHTEEKPLKCGESGGSSDRTEHLEMLSEVEASAENSSSQLLAPQEDVVHNKIETTQKTSSQEDAQNSQCSYTNCS